MKQATLACLAPTDFWNFVLGLWSTIVYTYIFHRHVSDGSFHIENEFKTPILPGLFDEVAFKNATILDERITDILEAASLHLPNSFFHLRLRPYDCQSSECLPPILVRLSSEAIKVNKKKLSPILQTFHRRLDNNSSFYFHPEKSLGALTGKSFSKLKLSLVILNFPAKN